jgi:hypothetical protein
MAYSNVVTCFPPVPHLQTIHNTAILAKLLLLFLFWTLDNKLLGFVLCINYFKIISNCYEIKPLYCHNLRVCDCRPTRDWILDLLIQLGTTGSYSATASLHTSQITTAPTKPFSACYAFNSRSLAMPSNSGDYSGLRVTAARAELLSAVNSP